MLKILMHLNELIIYLIIDQNELMFHLNQQSKLVNLFLNL